MTKQRKNKTDIDKIRLKVSNKKWSVPMDRNIEIIQPLINLIFDVALLPLGIGSIFRITKHRCSLSF